ncbi:MAG: alpha/beta hydrolase [Alphaproteobacteria bacterium]|nr:alpha/beta hydrolase [Alphaproteobacteria bacterium]
MTGGDRARLAAVLAGVRRYQESPYTRALPEMPAVAEAGGVRLRDYGSEGPAVVVVPSLINPPTVLDLAEGNSLLRWLAAQGFRPLLVDWGDGAAERGLDIGGQVEGRLVPMLAGLETPAVVGYCLGATMAVKLAALRPAARLALIAAPWRFSGYGAAARDAIAGWWTATRPSGEALGGVPMDLLQPMFWRLDPKGTVGKFEALGRSGAADPGFVALEDWANDGPPLSVPAARQLAERFFAADDPGEGRWAPLPAMPVLSFIAARDRIVPAAAAPDFGTSITVDAGHVGMIVGSRARAALWEPLAHFLRG